MFLSIPTRKFSFWALPARRYVSLVLMRVGGCFVYLLIAVLGATLVFFSPSTLEDTTTLLLLVGLALGIAMFVTLVSIVRDRFCHDQITTAQPSHIQDLDSKTVTASLWQLHNEDFARPKYFLLTLPVLYAYVVTNEVSVRLRTAVLFAHVFVHILILGLTFSSILTQDSVLTKLLGSVVVFIAFVQIVYSMLLPFKSNEQVSDFHRQV